MSIASIRVGSSLEPVISPVFVLAPPRSFTSIVCAMLGQHPEMYGLSELHLFSAETLSEWWEMGGAASFHMRDGLLRTVAQLYFGGQAPHTVAQALGWLRRRSHWTSGFMFEEIAKRVLPRSPVEKSPSIVYRVEYMLRALAMFPQARWIHLTRHPAGQGESIVKALRKAQRRGFVPYWLTNLASYPLWPEREEDEREARSAGLNRSEHGGDPFDLDPQRGWYQLNQNIVEFLKAVPAAQQVRVRGEDVLQNPDETLRDLATWLALRNDSEAIDEMKHPERSIYAFFGPHNAVLGNDGDFLANPRLAPERAKQHSLEAAPTWVSDGRSFSPQVKLLASDFGYR